jgi:hypothetical protein
VAQVVEHLPSKCKALRTNPNTTKINKNIHPCQAPVAHACNPSYSGGRDQEDLGSKSAQANSSQDPFSKKKNITKKGLMEWLKV